MMKDDNEDDLKNKEDLHIGGRHMALDIFRFAVFLKSECSGSLHALYGFRARFLPSFLKSTVCQILEDLDQQILQVLRHRIRIRLLRLLTGNWLDQPLLWLSCG